jgi:plasmid stabilization system protein ParE
MKPDLDHWLPDPSLRVAHRRASSASADRLWEAATSLRLSDTSRLGRLIRWRIPGTGPELSFDELFRQPPFVVLEADRDQALVAGVVGRIWTLRRDYPELADPEEFRGWATRGTARVLFANWVEPAGSGRAVLASETRAQPIGTQGTLGLAAVRPLISAFHHLVATDGIEAAVRLAERQPGVP